MDALIPWPAMVRRLRFLSSLTQYELAQQLGVDQGTVSRWERGTYIPDTYVQKRLRDLLRALEPAIDRSFIEQAPAIVIVSPVEPVGLVAAISAVAAAAYHLAPAEMRDLWAYDLMSESAHAFLKELGSNPAWQQGEISMWRAVVQRPDGNWARFTGSPIGNTDLFMAIGAVIPAPNGYTDKSYRLTLTSYDEMCD